MTSIQDIVDAFELLGDWEARFEYLIELGEQLTPMPADLRTETWKVQGCISQVWVRLRQDGPDRVELEGDSETAIIKGVVALLAALCHGRGPQEIVEMDFDALFGRLELAEHLSPNRHLGVYAIVDKITQQARRLASQAA
jgi:cysteine desulfuration protein SufE